ncbi:MAG: IS630 family transposase, partial [Verrucomicrobiota bacterium]
MKAYSKDLRDKVIQALEGGMSQSQAAHNFGIKRTTVWQYWKRYKQKGEVYYKQHGGHLQSKLHTYKKELIKWIKQSPGMTLEQMRERLDEQYKLSISQATLHYHLCKMGYSFKKTFRASERGRADIAIKRQQWKWDQLVWNPQKLVFLDETGVNTKMTGLYGRALRGERCHDQVPYGHWNSSTFLAALRYNALSAPLLIDGAIDGEMFVGSISQHLCPTLSKDDIVICDNLPAHKVNGVREAIEAVGAKLVYLPAYSPDLNPIEMAFAKFKTHLRQAAKRTWQELLEAVVEAFESFTPQEC